MSGRGWYLRVAVRLSLILLIAAVFVDWVRFEIALHEARQICQRPTVLDRKTSLDGAWEAVVVQVACGFTAAHLRLVSTRDPGLTGHILKLDTRGERAYMRPILAWTAPDVLRVTAAVVPTVNTLSFAGVQIDLRVDPDDPAIMAAKAEWERGARTRRGGRRTGPDGKGPLRRVRTVAGASRGGDGPTPAPSPTRRAGVRGPAWSRRSRPDAPRRPRPGHRGRTAHDPAQHAPVMLTPAA